MKNNYLEDFHTENNPTAIQINQIAADSTDGDISFAVQFTFSSKEIFEDRGKEFLKRLIIKMDEDFKNQYVYFGTMMEVLHNVDNYRSI